jgi:essential nuclear protein 1
MPKSQGVSARSPAGRRHNPLADDVSTTGGILRTKTSTGKRKSRSDEEANGDGYIDASSSRKILAIARELEDEDNEDRKAVAKAVAPNPAFAFDSRFADDEDNAQGGDALAYDDEDEDEWMPEEDVDVEDVDPADMAVYHKFLSGEEQSADFAPSIANLSTIDKRNDAMEEPAILDEAGETTNLADLILQRIAEKEALTSAQTSGRPVVHGGGPPEDAVEIPANVAEVFEK